MTIKEFKRKYIGNVVKYYETVLGNNEKDFYDLSFYLECDFCPFDGKCTADTSFDDACSDYLTDHID